MYHRQFRIQKPSRSLGRRILASLAAAAMVPGLCFPIVSHAAQTSSSTTQTTAGTTSRYAQTVSMADLIAPALTRNTNAAGVAQLLTQALRYGSITQGDIWGLIQEGYQIPTQSLQLMAQAGTISGYLYKMAAGLPLEPRDLSDVYDKEYYINNNPAISTAIADGTLPSDDQTVFMNFVRSGMSAGLAASSDFNPAYYKANYPELLQSIGDDNATLYIHYVLIGKAKGLVADHLLAQN